MKYLIERAKEQSTWQGVVLLLTALGLASSEQSDALLNFGLAFAALINVFLPDKI